MIQQVLKELNNHAPFTLFGAVSGLLLMYLCAKLPSHVSFSAFYILHPIHVLLSALVTASMYEIHKCSNGTHKCSLWILFVIGYIGSIGIATLSDSIIPFLGETLLQMPNRAIHIGFIEKWWLVNPMALLGIAIAYFRPRTKFPHAGHVLLSTWASLFHIIMAMSSDFSWPYYLAVFIFLFIAVWIPCCVSDIVFPLLFIKQEGNHSVKE